MDSSESLQLLLKRRTNLKRRFTRTSNRLHGLLSSSSPVRRYLEPDVRELEFLCSEINSVTEAIREELEDLDDEEKLNALDDWEAKFDEESMRTLDAANVVLESPVVTVDNTACNTSAASSEVKIKPTPAPRIRSGGKRPVPPPKPSRQLPATPSVTDTASLVSEVTLSDSASDVGPVQSWLHNVPREPPRFPQQQLKPLELPKFDGEARSYARWRQTFKRLVDEDPYMSEDLKLARLKEALRGSKAEDIVGEMFDGEGAYLAAWSELERWYGGTDRHLAMQEQEILGHPRLSNDRDTDGIRKFAMKLRNVLVNLDLCQVTPGRELFLSAIEKLPRSLVVRFYEQHQDEQCNVTTLSQWLVKRVINAKRADDVLGPREPSRAKTTASTHVTNAPAVQPAQSTSCPKCRQQHSLATCAEFSAMTCKSRWRFVRLLNLCVNCLSSDHWAKDCRSSPCPSCKGSHHQLLHFDKEKKSTTSKAASRQSEECAAMTETQSASPPVSTVSFMTAPVLVTDGTKSVRCTALLDPASTASYVKSDVAKALGIRGRRRQLTTLVLGGRKVEGSYEHVTMSVQSVDKSVTATLGAWVMDDAVVAAKPVNWTAMKQQWKHLEAIDFPDIDAEVGMLIGLNAVQLHTSLEERSGNKDAPIARRTPLGWVCMGPTSSAATQEEANVAIALHSEDQLLSDTVNSFWELENAENHKAYLTPAERAAEQHTDATLRYDGTRFEVGVPWVHSDGQPHLQSNRPLAEKRLWSLQRSLEKKPAVRLEYSAVLKSYLEKEYIQQVHPSVVKADGERQWFLPHFPVVREDKSTTKVRIVFDASVKYEGVSLNDQMYTGPRTQNNIVHVLLRFCVDPVVLVGDISQMFLQVRLSPADRKYFRFLWREGEETTNVYEFNRVVFGAKASPYLAGKVLKSAAEKFESSAASATDVKAIVDDSFYVDDMLAAFSSVNTATDARQDIQSVLGEGGFHIRKWLSNSVEVLKSIPEADRSPDIEVTLGDDSHPALPSSKTLGITWSADSDTFTFIHNPPASTTRLTKRTVLSKMASVFDPRGQLSPFTIRSRVLFQQVCISGCEWDEALNPELAQRWKCWFDQLAELEKVKVDRCFKLLDYNAQDGALQVHIFTDAADSAYAAAAYIRCEYPDGTVKTTLALSKARPAPMRKLSIPKMELKGAVLGVQLSQVVAEALRIPIDHHVFWSDSMNVLYWVRSHSRRFVTDVGNKISEIHASTKGSQWRHVPGKVNPADKPTRGMSADELATSQEWWHGPDFLRQPATEWPHRDIIVPSQLPGESKRSLALAYTAQEVDNESRLNPSRYSSWQRLVRVTAWCFRFIDCCRKPRPATKGESELTSSEINKAELHWIAKAQEECYPQTYRRVMSGAGVQATDPLLRLQPMADKESPIMRVGGRLKTASHLPASTRHPIIIPQHHRVTELIVDAEDRRCNHSVGPNHLLTNIMANGYWIIRGKVVTRSHRTHCVICRKKWAALSTQQIAPLPSFRTAPPYRVFSRVGIDYAGPFLTKAGRGRAQHKRYLCVFSCLQTRACHLEIAYAMDTESFLLAFSRFCKRRGVPAEVVSDNGTNFVGAERELRESLQALDNDGVKSSMANQGIRWKFNPPQSPHFGGVFECVVKAAKRAMMSTLAQASLTDEELVTAATQAESLLNSRPLTAVSADIDDLQPLTPYHFIMGHCEVDIPLEDNHDKLHPQRRWKYLQKLMTEVWQRWIREFVPKYNTLTKWSQKVQNMKVGDVVLCLDKQTPRGKWPMGRVTSTRPGADGLVRVVDVRTQGKIVRRSIHNLVQLDVEPEK